jgi:hypothetical protein
MPLCMYFTGDKMRAWHGENNGERGDASIADSLASVIAYLLYLFAMKLRQSIDLGVNSLNIGWSQPNMAL